MEVLSLRAPSSHRALFGGRFAGSLYFCTEQSRNPQKKHTLGFHLHGWTRSGRDLATNYWALHKTFISPAGGTGCTWSPGEIPQAKRKGKGDILMKWELQTAKRDRQRVEDAHSEYTCELPALSILRALGNASLPPLVTSSVPLQILVDLRYLMLKPTWPSESPWRQISMWHLKSASPLHYLRWVSVVTVSHNEQWRLMLCIQFSTCSNNIPKGSLNFNDVRRSQPHHGSS